MSITNGYCTEAELMDELGGDSIVQESGKNERAINAASRLIDKHCGQRFWQDSAVVDRQYFPDSPTELCLDEGISTLTGLVVKVDSGDDGTFGTTLTINTDFIVEPVNAADGYPVLPYTTLRLLTNASTYFIQSPSGRASVQVTAKFGWPAVPDAVKSACIFQAATMLSSAGAVGGIVQLSGFDGVGMRIGRLHPQAAELLAGPPYTKVYV